MDRHRAIAVIRTQCTPLRDMLAKLGHAYEKRVPAMVQAWSPELIRIFLEAVIDGREADQDREAFQPPFS